MAFGGDPHHLDSSGEPPEQKNNLNAVSDGSKHTEDMLRRYGQASTDPAREPPPPVRPEPSPGTRGPGPPAPPASPAPLAARQPKPDPALKNPPLRFHHPPGPLTPHPIQPPRPPRPRPAPPRPPRPRQRRQQTRKRESITKTRISVELKAGLVLVRGDGRLSAKKACELRGPWKREPQRPPAICRSLVPWVTHEAAGAA